MTDVVTDRLTSSGAPPYVVRCRPVPVGPGRARLALSCLLVLAAACAPAGRREIIFSSSPYEPSDSTTSDLWAMQPDGSGLRRLTDGYALGRNESSFPALSPDGRQIAFTVSPFAATGRRASVHLMDLDGGNDHVLVPLDSLDARFPAWSPDGRRIAFVTHARGARPGLKIRIVDVDGSGLTTVPEVANVRGCLSWARSGDALYGSVLTPGGTGRVVRIGLPEGRTETVVSSDTLLFSCPVESPDGRTLLVSAQRWPASPLAPNHVYVVEQGALRPFAPLAGFSKDAYWSADGSQVVFHGSDYAGFTTLSPGARADSIEIYIADRSGLHVTRLTFNTHFDVHPTW